MWEELRVGISYTAEKARAEQILLEAARRHTKRTTEMGEDCLKELERRYALRRSDMEPRVFWRLTDNWVELSVRFITEDHGIRYVKDAMSRDILREFEDARLSIASGTYAIVEFPEVSVKMR